MADGNRTAARITQPPPIITTAGAQPTAARTRHTTNARPVFPLIEFVNATPSDGSAPVPNEARAPNGSGRESLRVRFMPKPRLTGYSAETKGKSHQGTDGRNARRSHECRYGEADRRPLVGGAPAVTARRLTAPGILTNVSTGDGVGE